MRVRLLRLEHLVQHGMAPNTWRSQITISHKNFATFKQRQT